ncbi:unnamed protein product, partial [Mesorhabditis belari]|uniref:Uncharacterized protein n=1 Tax=Mesorhabditis belari TaxID=2138241 RepID=A0AAF3EL18_9BILA
MPNNCPNEMPYLDETNPAQQFSGTELSQSELAICYNMATCSGDGCSFMIHVTFLCTNAESNDTMPCSFIPNQMPFLNALAHEKPDPGHDCIKKPIGDLFLQYCTWYQTGDKVGLEWDQTSTIDSSTFAFMFHVNQWMPSNTFFMPIPFTTSIKNFEFSLGESNRDGWIVMSFDRGQLNYLAVKSTKNDPKCAYDLRLFNPPGIKNSIPDEFHLFTINETEPYVEQFLENAQYSLRIPAGCSPTIRLSQDERGKGGWYDEAQGLCEGTALVTTPGYLDPFNVFPDGYFLSRMIYCLSFLSSYALDVQRVIGQDVSVTLFDRQLDPILDFTIPAQTSYKSYPIFEDVGAIKFHWPPNAATPNSGMAARHRRRSFFCLEVSKGIIVTLQLLLIDISGACRHIVANC